MSRFAFWRRRTPPVPDMPVWHAWRDIQRAQPLGRFFVSAVISRYAEPNTGYDVISGIRAKRALAPVVTRLESLADGDLEALLTLAELNSERQQYLARILLLAYFTVPLTVGALWLQLDPKGLAASFRIAPSAWGAGVASAGAAVVLRLLVEAQARNVVTLVRCLTVERSVSTSAES